MSFLHPFPPLRAALLIEGERHDALECSAAGVSLPRAALPGDTMQRGDECPATLFLSGPGGEEAHEVTVRLAAHGPRHVEFAFVALPPSARRVLGERGAPGSRGEDLSSEHTPGEPLPRRLMLHVSAAVAEVTRGRRPQAERPEAASAVTTRPTSAQEALPVAVLLLVTTGVLALAALIGWLLVR